MKTALITLLILIIVGTSAYCQDLKLSKEISIITIDSLQCQDIYLIIFTIDSISPETRAIVTTKSEYNEKYKNLIQISSNYIVNIAQINDLFSNIKYSCLTRLQGIKALYIDKLLIWDKPQSIFPYICLSIYKKK
jgi:hypothetical protein